jgi:hypothetical protein
MDAVTAMRKHDVDNSTIMSCLGMGMSWDDMFLRHAYTQEAGPSGVPRHERDDGSAAAGEKTGSPAADESNVPVGPAVPQAPPRRGTDEEYTEQEDIAHAVAAFKLPHHLPLVYPSAPPQPDWHWKGPTPVPRQPTGPVFGTEPYPLNRKLVLTEEGAWDEAWALENLDKTTISVCWWYHRRSYKDLPVARRHVETKTSGYWLTYATNSRLRYDGQGDPIFVFTPVWWVEDYLKLCETRWSSWGAIFSNGRALTKSAIEDTQLFRKLGFAAWAIGSGLLHVMGLVLIACGVPFLLAALLWALLNILFSWTCWRKVRPEIWTYYGVREFVPPFEGPGLDLPTPYRVGGSTMPDVRQQPMRSGKAVKGARLRHAYVKQWRQLRLTGWTSVDGLLSRVLQTTAQDYWYSRTAFEDISSAKVMPGDVMLNDHTVDERANRYSQTASHILLGGSGLEIQNAVPLARIWAGRRRNDEVLHDPQSFRPAGK